MVAQRYFLEHGYAGTTMSGIAAALGGSKGTLWNHFPSKEDLFSAVLDRATRSFQAELSQILNPCGELTATLLRACISLIEKLTSPDAIALHRLIIAEGARFPEMRQIFFDLAPLRVRYVFGTFLQGAMARGQLRVADPFDAARALIALVMSGGHQQLLMGQLDHASATQTTADADFAVTTFLRAYAPDGPPMPAGQSA
jgi:TetR/AcrR family transcriptional repressor of mexJK operon